MTGQDQDDMLQQYFDGELADDEAEALRLEIEGDESLQAKLEGLSHLRMLLHATLAPERLSTPDAEAMFSSVTARLAEEDAEEDEVEEAAAETAIQAEPNIDSESAPMLRSIEGGKKDTAPAAEAEGPSNGPVWIGVAGLVLAAAAAWFFFMRPAEVDPTQPDPTEGPVAVADPPPGSEIEQIDFGHSTGAIFQVEEEGTQYAVIWISDEKPDDRMPEAIDEDTERIQ